MTGRTRFSKLFVIIAEMCSKWLLEFLKSRLPPSLSVYDYIHQPYDKNKKMLRDSIISAAVERKKIKGLINDDFDVSALERIIKIGGLINESGKCNEIEDTIKDAIKEIRLQRNDFMHTTEANKDEDEYKDLMTKLKKLAFLFEIANGKLNREYQKEIQDIDKKIFDEEEVRNTIIHYNKWVMVIKSIEIPPLIVPGPPSVYIQQPKYNVIHTQSVTLECKVSSENITSVLWQRNKYGNIQTISSSTNENKYRGSSPQCPSLTIFNATKDDAGGYRCIATNFHGEGKSTETILCVDECRPLVSIQQSLYNVTAGQNVTFVCTVSPDSDVIEIRWKKGSQYIPSDPNCKKYTGSTINIPSLTILNVNYDDHGNYTCEARNRFLTTGESENINLSVIGELPTVRYGQIEYVAESGQTVTLDCNVDSHLPVTDVYWGKGANYQKEIIKADTNSQKYSGSTPNCPSLTINNVDSNDAGSYTCFVSNSYGKMSTWMPNYTLLKVRKKMESTFETKRLAAEYSQNSTNAFAAAIDGACGGAVGLVKDIFNAFTK